MMLFMSKLVSLPKISSILQEMKIGQKPIYALSARSPSIVFLDMSKLCFIYKTPNSFSRFFQNQDCRCTTSPCAFHLLQEQWWWMPISFQRNCGFLQAGDDNLARRFIENQNHSSVVQFCTCRECTSNQAAEGCPQNQLDSRPH